MRTAAELNPQDARSSLISLLHTHTYIYIHTHAGRCPKDVEGEKENESGLRAEQMSFLSGYL